MKPIQERFDAIRNDLYEEGIEVQQQYRGDITSQFPRMRYRDLNRVFNNWIHLIVDNDDHLDSREYEDWYNTEYNKFSDQMELMHRLTV